MILDEVSQMCFHPRFDPQTGLLTGTKDGNLVNIFLRLFGRCSEQALCIRLLIFQVDSKRILAANYYFTLLQICFLNLDFRRSCELVDSVLIIQLCCKDAIFIDISKILIWKPDQGLNYFLAATKFKKELS